MKETLEIEKFNIYKGFGSCFLKEGYELPENFQTDWQGALVTAKAPGTRSGGMFAIEGNRWIVTLAGIGRDYFSDCLPNEPSAIA